MSRTSSRRRPPASHPTSAYPKSRSRKSQNPKIRSPRFSAPLKLNQAVSTLDSHVAFLQARHRELTTKRRGELAELAFTLKAYALGFGVSKPYGDSERYDTVIDARDLLPHPVAPATCHPERSGPVRKADRLAKSKDPVSLALSTDLAGNFTLPPSCPLRVTVVKTNPSHTGCPISAAPFAAEVGLLPSNPQPSTKRKSPRTRGPRGAARAAIPPQTHLAPPLWRVQVKCSTQLVDGMYRINAARRLHGRAVPYQPGEIDFLAAYIIPEDTWYIVPLDAFLGLTALLFRRHDDLRPGQYDDYEEAWHQLRPKMMRCWLCGAGVPTRKDET